MLLILLSFSLFCLGGALAFWAVIIKMESILFFAILFTVLGFCCLISCIILWWWQKRFPSKDKWEYYSYIPNDDGKVVENGRIYWSSNKPQCRGMFYCLNLKTERIILGISFHQGHSNNIPEEVEISLLDKSHKSLFKKLGTDGHGIQLETPIKAQYVILDLIKEKMENGKPNFWNIRDILLTEKQIFWEKII